MHGHVDVPQTYKDNKSLGKWVGKQREQFKVYFKNVHSPPDEVVSCAMTEERMRRLNEIGFKWSMGKGQYGMFMFIHACVHIIMSYVLYDPTACLYASCIDHKMCSNLCYSCN